jgi:hypothetical protein
MDIKTILESKEAIETLTAKNMPLNIAIKVSKVQKELNNVLDIYQERRKGLFEKYGEGEDLHIPEENKKSFLDDHDELIEEDLDIIIDPINTVELGNIEISPNHLTNLAWLLV